VQLKQPADLQTFLQMSTMREWSASEYLRMLLPSSCLLLLDMGRCWVPGRKDAFMQLLQARELNLRVLGSYVRFASRHALSQPYVDYKRACCTSCKLWQPQADVRLRQSSADTAPSRAGNDLHC
jgi:hypothetical protein